MPFAFNPDDRPARIFRYVEPGTLPSRDIVSLYSKEANLLIIDKANFEKLSPMQKHLVLRTHEPCIEVDYFKKYRVWGLAA